jgi:hypothetical protein
LENALELIITSVKILTCNKTEHFGTNQAHFEPNFSTFPSIFDITITLTYDYTQHYAIYSGIVLQISSEKNVTLWQLVIDSFSANIFSILSNNLADTVSNENVIEKNQNHAKFQIKGTTVRKWTLRLRVALNLAENVSENPKTSGMKPWKSQAWHFLLGFQHFPRKFSAKTLCYIFARF